MAWESSYFETGKLEIVNGNVGIYLPHGYYMTQTVGNAVNARWEGRDLIVTLSDGTMRRYTNKNQYSKY